MKRSKILRLKKAGWRVSSAQEFLGLSDHDMELIELKRSLMQMVRETRRTNKITQIALAKLLESSQSRVAKIESASPDVSLDLILKALFAMGVSPKRIGKVISS